MNIIKSVLMAGLILSSVGASLSIALPLFEIRINRNMTCMDQSTMGTLYVGGMEIGRTLELPWKNNESSISHVPAGSYDAIMRSDGNKRWRIELKDVSDRGSIQIHVGNYASEIDGCILLGKTINQYQGSCMVTDSNSTLEKLREKIVAFADQGNMTTAIDIKVIIQ